MSALLLLVLLVDAVIVGPTSTIMWAVGSDFLPDKLLTPPGPLRDYGVFYERDSGGVLRQTTPPTIAAAPEPKDPFTLHEGWWVGVVVASVRIDSTSTGWWAPTTRHFDSRLHVSTAIDSPPTAVEHERIRTDIADALAEKHVSQDAAALAPLLKLPEDDDVRIPISWGYAHNAMTLVVLGSFVWSLGWVPRMVTDRIRVRRRAAGLCPFCRYDMRGLATAKCPECGKGTSESRASTRGTNAGRHDDERVRSH